MSRSRSNANKHCKTGPRSSRTSIAIFFVESCVSTMACNTVSERIRAAIPCAAARSGSSRPSSSKATVVPYRRSKKYRMPDNRGRNILFLLPGLREGSFFKFAIRGLFSYLWMVAVPELRMRASPPIAPAPPMISTFTWCWMISAGASAGRGAKLTKSAPTGAL